MLRPDLKSRFFRVSKMLWSTCFIWMKTVYLSRHMEVVVPNVIQRNEVFPHFEKKYLIWSNTNTHCEGKERRATFEYTIPVRQVEESKLNSNAQEYFNLILVKWMLERIANYKKFEEWRTWKGHEIANFPCHFQAFKRNYKTGNRTLSECLWWESCEGFIRSRLKRCCMAQFETKYNVLEN